MSVLVAPFSSQIYCHVHLFSFVALSTNIFEANGGRPIDAEMPMALFLLSRSSDVPRDPEKLAGWSKYLEDEVPGGSTIEDCLAASWGPT